jgi:hypothetical protein
MRGSAIACWTGLIEVPAPPATVVLAPFYGFPEPLTVAVQRKAFANFPMHSRNPKENPMPNTVLPGGFSFDPAAATAHVMEPTHTTPSEARTTLSRSGRNDERNDDAWGSIVHKKAKDILRAARLPSTIRMSLRIWQKSIKLSNFHRFCWCAATFGPRSRCKSLTGITGCARATTPTRTPTSPSCSRCRTDFPTPQITIRIQEMTS